MNILRHSILILAILVSCASEAYCDGWERALPGWRYEFPRDHGDHPDFKTEWWYFTGNLRDEKGREFGYQLTFFRQGVRAPGDRAPVRSRYVVDRIALAHFAFTDVAEGKFHFAQKLSRGAFGDAGFDEGDRLAWVGDWSLNRGLDDTFELVASHDDVAIALRVKPKKPPTIHGRDGVSQKADGLGNASHYYSLTRLQTTGTVTVKGESRSVRGESWFDHEWATNQLAANQTGWDWFSVQLADGSELMLYQLRLDDGSADPNSSGTFVDGNGTATHLERADYSLEPLAFYESGETGGRYPISWRIEVPSLQLSLAVETPLKGQELSLKPVAYWEGLIHVRGTRAGKPVAGHGYMELTGYAGDVVGLRER